MVDLMMDYLITILQLLFYLFCEIVFCSGIKVECIPDTPGIFLSSHKSYVTIYNFSENKQLSGENAAIFCTIEGRKYFVKMETIIYGELPKSLFLETENETYSMLHSKVVCSVSDIIDINHVIPEAEVAFHNKTFGDVTYTCGEQGLKFVLEGLQMLTRNLSRLVQLSGKTDDTECLRNIENNKTRVKLGEACAPGKRSMFDSTGEFVCSQCCAGYYWNITIKRCHECGPCGKQDKPNIWTVCIPIPCKHMIDAPTRAILPTTKQPKTSTTTTEIPKETTAEGKSSNLGPIIIGCVIGGVVAVLGGVAAYCYWKKCGCFKKERRQSSYIKGEKRPKTCFFSYCGSKRA